MPHELSPDMRDAVESAYRVFSRNPYPQDAWWCDRCVDPLTQKLYAETPLREIDAELMSTYTGHCAYEDGIARYFAPRLIELLAQGEEVGTSGDGEDGLILFSQVEWRAGWPADEVAALDRSFEVWFRDTMRLSIEAERERAEAEGREPWTLNWFIWRVGIAGCDAALPLVKIAHEMQGRSADLRLAAFVNEMVEEARPWREIEAADFSARIAVKYIDARLYEPSNHNLSAQRLAAWERCAAPAFQQRLEEAAVRESDPHWRAELARANAIVAALIEVRQTQDTLMQKCRVAMAAPADMYGRVPTLNPSLLFYHDAFASMRGDDGVRHMFAAIAAIQGRNVDLQIAGLAAELFADAVRRWEVDNQLWDERAPRVPVDISPDIDELKRHRPLACTFLADPAILARLEALQADAELQRTRYLLIAAKQIIAALIRDRAGAP